MKLSNESINRRAFLGVSAAGAAAIASGMLFGVPAADKTIEDAKKIFVCGVCGHVEFGEAPALCPVCHAPKERFIQNDSLFVDAQAKSPDLVLGHVPEISVVKSSKLITEEPVKDVIVRIGKKLHPMTDAHHIQWIDAYVDGHYFSRFSLTPGSEPAVSFYPRMSGSRVRIVEHCNLHGHWQAEAML